MTDSGDFAQEQGDAPLPAGTRLGKYEVVRLLGAGGMGAVYEAAHTEIGKRVAVKVLGPAIAAVPGARARFLREAQLTSKVRHPNIVDVTDMGNEGVLAYLVMEFLEGLDLSQRLARVGRIPSAELVDIMLPVCSAVSAAHQAGITHRDLKPQNIFLAEEAHAMLPKVLDFGISKGTDNVGAGTLTSTGAMIGTPFYLAPEQILDGKTAGPASDQYALGVILYECLAGRRPFDGDNLFGVFQAIVNGATPPPRAVAPEIAPGLERVILRAMKVDPKARYRSVMHLARALLPFATSRARVLWEGSFGAPDAGDDVTPDAARADAGPAAADRRVVAGLNTRPAVVPAPRSEQENVETWDLSASRRPLPGWMKAFAVGIGLVAAGLVALLVLGGKSSTDEPDSPPAAAHAPAAPSAPVHAPAAPAPAAARAPAVAPVAAPTPVVPSAPAARPEAPAPPVEPELEVGVAPGTAFVPAAKPPGPRRPSPRPPRRPRENTAAEPAPVAPYQLNPNGAPVID